MSNDDTVYKVPEPPVPTTFQLESPRGPKLATRVWPCTNNNSNHHGGPPRAIVLFVHGGGWHSGYFDGLAKRLNRQGIFCAGYDQACHGYSEPEPHAPDGVIHIQSFDDLVEDLFAATVWAKEEAGYQDLPFFLFGESFGGLQALAAALESKFYGVKFAGVIVSGAAIEIAPRLLPPAPIVRILGWLAPYYPRFKMPATDMSSTFDDAFGDKEWAAIARQDPKVKVSMKATLAGVAATVTTGEEVAQQASKFPVPLLAIHSVNDCRTQCLAVQKFVDQAGSPAEGFWIEDTTGHQLLQDRPEVTQRVMDKIADWINKQVILLSK